MWQKVLQTRHRELFLEVLSWVCRALDLGQGGDLALECGTGGHNKPR